MKTSIDIVVDILNEALEKDPKAIREIFNVVATCNEHTADHPSIQVRKYYGTFLLTPLGLINGLVEPLTGQKVMATWQDGKLIKFNVYKGEK